MKTNHPQIEYKGRSLGIIILTGVQLLIGFIHFIYGFWLLNAPTTESFGMLDTKSIPTVYSIYTIVFGLLTLLFAILLWFQKTAGWAGTFAVLAFVVAVDSLTLLNLSSIPGIPKLAGYGEIPYSIIILLYLLKKSVRKKYLPIK